MLKRRLGLHIMMLMLIFNITIIIPDNANIVFAKTTTLRELKKNKKENTEAHEKERKDYPYGLYFSLYRCKGKVVRWDEFLEHASTSYITYYRLKADGKTLKLICNIAQKSYFDEKASTYKMKYKIKRAGSSKYIKLSKKKFKKLEKKYKIIKEL